MPTIPNLESVIFTFKTLTVDIMLLGIAVLTVFFWRKHWCLYKSDTHHDKTSAHQEAKDAANLTSLVGVLLISLHLCWIFGVFK